MKNVKDNLAIISVNRIKQLLTSFQVRTLYLWYKREKRFKSFLKSATGLAKQIEEGQELFVVIQPWQTTQLPWFLIALTVAFSCRGKSASIIWDDIGLRTDSRGERIVQRSIKRMLAGLPQSIKYFRLSEFNLSEKKLLSESQIERLVRKNKIIHFRGEAFPERNENFENKVKKILRKTAGHIQSFMQKCHPSYIVMGGGGYSSSGLWIELGKIMNTRVATIDSGFSILLVSTEGIAANLDDIPKAFHMMPKEDLWVINKAQTELKRRMSGTDQFNSQNVPATGEGCMFGVVLPLNQSYDLSALERHRVFKNQTEWMLETIEWVLNNSSEKIAIRRHPVERFPQFASNDDYQSLIESRFGKNDRVFYIDSNAPVNTYDLIQNARVVVPYVSTVGIEAAALGKPVVTEGASCYSELGFVWSAKTREEYFNLLRRALNGELIVDKKKQEDAWRCYYLTQCCNFYNTIFTPQPVDFDKWVGENPHDLLSSAEVSDVLEAIDKNIPLPIINHCKHKPNKREIYPIDSKNN